MRTRKQQRKSQATGCRFSLFLCLLLPAFPASLPARPTHLAIREKVFLPVVFFCSSLFLQNSKGTEHVCVRVCVRVCVCVLVIFLGNELAWKKCLHI